MVARGVSIYVRKSAGELSIQSSKNADRTFNTLSEDEKVVLGTMAGPMQENTVTFQILDRDCEPIIHAAQISDTARLMLHGTIICTGNGAYGSWYADKTNSALPVPGVFRDGETPKSGAEDGSGLATANSSTPCTLVRCAASPPDPYY